MILAARMVLVDDELFFGLKGLRAREIDVRHPQWTLVHILFLCLDRKFGSPRQKLYPQILQFLQLSILLFYYLIQSPWLYNTRKDRHQESRLLAG